jgi:hypothetical protein
MLREVMDLVDISSLVEVTGDPVIDILKAFQIFWNKAYLVPNISVMLLVGVLVVFIHDHWIVVQALWELLNLSFGC